MGWVRIDDGFFRHRKVVGISNDARVCFMAMLCYSADQMTDGILSGAEVRSVVGQIGVKPAAVKELIEVELCHKHGDGVEVHDYLSYQPSAAEERKRRADTKERVQRMRSRRTNGGRNPPGNGGGNAVTSGVTSGVTYPPGNAGRNGVGNPPCTTTPDPEVPPSLTEELLLVPGVVETETEIEKAKALATRAIALLRDAGGRPKPPEVCAMLGWSFRYLDLAFVDQVIGECGALNDRPKTVRYLATTLHQRGVQQGVEMPEWQLERRP
jgi:hypothetical protein